MSEEEEKKKDIEIVQGDGKDLKISPVYDHIKLDKPDKKKKKNNQVVIPEKKKPRDN